MTHDIGTITSGDGVQIFVEVIDSTPLKGMIDDLPEGAEPTGFSDTSSVERLKANIAEIARWAQEAFKEHGPSEWSVEFQIGFKGKASPIPILVSTEAESVLKFVATWQKG